MKQLKQLVPIEIQELSGENAKYLQTILKFLGYYEGQIDGIIGPVSTIAFAEWKEDHWLEHPTILGETTLERLTVVYRNRVNNDHLPIFKTVNRQTVIQALLESCVTLGLSLRAQKAYVLATVEHETNNTFMPVKEAYWFSEHWRRNNLRYYPYYGRGFVQLTWRANYLKYENILKLPLVSDPELALRADVSVFICVHGMAQGTFTGKRLADYVDENRTDYYNARRVVNWIDKAQHIANLAAKWEANF